MKSCGIIAEYHPFHKGHLYHLKEAKKQSQADIIVVVMSGQWMQRGEPALINKHYRTQLALYYGADLVIELPWFYAVQSADLFGQGAIHLLSCLGVDSFCFGTEDSGSFDYHQFAIEEKKAKSKLEQAFSEVNQNNTWSYPKKVAQAYQLVFPEYKHLFEQPNHLLGMAYARANIHEEHTMKLYTLKRKKAAHRSKELGSIASGTAIRHAVLEKNTVSVAESVPPKTKEVLDSVPIHQWEEYFPLLKYKVLTTPVEQLAQIYQMTEGMEYRVKKAANICQTFAEWLDFLATARYTKARIQRLSTYILMNTTNEEMQYSLCHPYIKVLGMTKEGQSFLKQTEATLPIITNIRKQNTQLKQSEEKYERIYTLWSEEEGFQKNYHPLIVEEAGQWNNNEKYHY